MLLNPFCPVAGAKILGLQATVILLLTLLIKGTSKNPNRA